MKKSILALYHEAVNENKQEAWEQMVEYVVRFLYSANSDPISRLLFLCITSTIPPDKFLASLEKTLRTMSSDLLFFVCSAIHCRYEVSQMINEMTRQEQESKSKLN